MMWRERAYPVHAWKQSTWKERVDAFLATEDTPVRFNWPFPMGVFGTLRYGHGNSRLMHHAEIEARKPAFLPHFNARGLGICCEEDSSAPFEIYTYTPEEWVKMIYSVDCLEGFDPQNDHGKTNGGYYFRTLAWLRQIESDKAPEAPKWDEVRAGRWFPTEGRPLLGEYRNMKIHPEVWNKFEAIPCWIYSNIASNKDCAKLDNSPIIWPTTGKR